MFKYNITLDSLSSLSSSSSSSSSSYIASIPSLSQLSSTKSTLSLPSSTESLNKPFSSNTKSTIFLSFFIFIASLSFIATIYEYLIYNYPIICTLHKNSTNLSRESLASHSSRGNKLSLFSRILLSFSYRRNIAKLFSTSKQETFSSIHGFRVLSMFWIITGHSYTFALQWLNFKNGKDTELPNGLINNFFSNSIFTVDTFFFISGLLVSHISFKKLQEYKKFNYLTYCIHRYIRMTPVMMVIIGFGTTILPSFGDDNHWFESIKMYDQWCEKNWWLNALYLHNFFNTDSMCLSHSWYSAVDMQLYLIAPLILIPLYKWQKFGITIVVMLFLSCTFITAYLTIVNHFPSAPYIDIANDTQLVDFYQMIYIKPWSRMGPYIIGLIFGYILFKNNDNRDTLKKSYQIIAWLLSTIILIGVMGTRIDANNGSLTSDIFAGIYSSISKTLWAMVLSWIVYSCVHYPHGTINYLLSMKPLIPFSRLTYSAYLIHPIIIAIFYATQKTTFYFSYYLMMYFVIGNIIITYVASMLLTIIIEFPIHHLENLILS